MLIGLIFNLILTFNFTHANEGSTCVNCSDLDKVQGGIVAMFTEAKNAVEKYLCEPKIGHPITINSKASGSDIKRKFKLTKISNLKYVAEVNLMFVDLRGEKKDWKLDSKSIHSLTKERRKFVSACLAEYNPYLRGPAGESLIIKISDDAPQVNIAVKESTHRPYSKIYREDIDCPTVLHEILHLFGLSDEYKEKSKGYLTNKAGERVRVQENAEILAYDCRSAPGVTSIMNSQEDAISQIRPYYMHVACVCEVSNNLYEVMGCQKKLSSMNGKPYNSKDCPKGTTKWAYKSGDSIPDPNTFQIEPIKKMLGKSSVLMPAHFRMITNPNCMSPNEKYLKCTSSAYESSQELRSNKCSDIARKCKENGDFLN